MGNSSDSERSTAVIMQNDVRPKPMTFDADALRWAAVRRRDRAADGHFVYAVRTTGVYCRPSCGARLARRENVEFHHTPTDAERTGFRACKRCAPNGPPAATRDAEIITRACAAIAEAQEPPSV